MAWRMAAVRGSRQKNRRLPSVATAKWSASVAYRCVLWRNSWNVVAMFRTRKASPSSSWALRSESLAATRRGHSSTMRRMSASASARCRAESMSRLETTGTDCANGGRLR